MKSVVITMISWWEHWKHLPAASSVHDLIYNSGNQFKILEEKKLPNKVSLRVRYYRVSNGLRIFLTVNNGIKSDMNGIFSGLLVPVFRAISLTVYLEIWPFFKGITVYRYERYTTKNSNQFFLQLYFPPFFLKKSFSAPELMNCKQKFKDGQSRTEMCFKDCHQCVQKM